MNTAADVLAQYIYATGLASIPGQNHPWPLFVNSMPELPDQAITVYDQVGLLDGKDMRTGKTLIHDGFQFRFRSRDNRIAGALGLQFKDELDSIYRDLVVITPITYLIQAVTLTTPVIPIGAEEGGSRLLYTLNGILTYGVNI